MLCNGTTATDSLRMLFLKKIKHSCLWTLASLRCRKANRPVSCSLIQCRLIQCKSIDFNELRLVPFYTRLCSYSAILKRVRASFQDYSTSLPTICIHWKFSAFVKLYLIENSQQLHSCSKFSSEGLSVDCNFLASPLALPLRMFPPNLLHGEP